MSSYFFKRPLLGEVRENKPKKGPQNKPKRGTRNKPFYYETCVHATAMFDTVLETAQTVLPHDTPHGTIAQYHKLSGCAASEKDDA